MGTLRHGDAGGGNHERWGPKGQGHEGMETWGRGPWGWGPRDGHLGVGGTLVMAPLGDGDLRVRT